jgi:hypothetical protein
MSPWHRNKDRSKLEDLAVQSDGQLPPAGTSAASQELDLVPKQFVLTICLLCRHIDRFSATFSKATQLKDNMG